MLDPDQGSNSNTNPEKVKVPIAFLGKLSPIPVGRYLIYCYKMCDYLVSIL